MTESTKHEDTLRVLEGARDLIAAGWTQYNYAENAEGERAMWHDAAACCFCATGALARAGKDGFDEWGGWIARDAMVKLADRLDVMRAQGEKVRNDSMNPYTLSAHDKVAEYNDMEGRTQGEILALLDHVIATERLI